MEALNFQEDPSHGCTEEVVKRVAGARDAAGGRGAAGSSPWGQRFAMERRPPANEADAQSALAELRAVDDALTQHRIPAVLYAANRVPC